VNKYEKFAEKLKFTMSLLNCRWFWNVFFECDTDCSRKHVGHWCVQCWWVLLLMALF